MNVLIQGKSAADRTKVVEIAVDPYSGAISTIETEHQRIHTGEGFAISGKATALAAGASAYIYAVTGAVPIHWRAATIASGDGEIDITFYENPTVSANGTAQTVVNKNRMSSNTSSLTIYTGPTVTTPGTLLETGWIPPTGGVGSHNTGGEAERIGGEWILNPSYNYLVKITNSGASPIDYSYSFFWYEDV